MRNEREANLLLTQHYGDAFPEPRMAPVLRPSVPLRCRDLRWLRTGFLTVVVLVVGLGWLLVRH